MNPHAVCADASPVSTPGLRARVDVVGITATGRLTSWSDVVTLNDARRVVILGEAIVDEPDQPDAAAIGTLRAIARAVARLDLAPWQALQQVDAAVSETVGVPVTLSYVVFDAVTGAATLAQAGSLPPVAVSSTGRVTALSVPLTAPLGLGCESYSDSVHAIDWGGGLVLRSSASVSGTGVVSGLRTRRTADDGPLDEVVRAAERVVGSCGAGAIIAVLARCGSQRDVVIRRFPSMTQAPRLARTHAARATARWPGAGPALALVVSELVGNVVRHTQSAAVEVRLARLDHGVLVEVEDASATPPHLFKSSWMDVRGRGLRVVADLAAAWGFRWVPGGKVVWAQLEEAP